MGTNFNKMYIFWSTDGTLIIFLHLSHFKYRLNNNNKKVIKLGSIIIVSLFVEVLEEGSRGSYSSSKSQ